ncbi:MAG TPA: glucokinase, partial [Usitatibacteraceae bacterium]|nr:glucokinase [Usitatibacteraceae bacterium]
MPAPRRLIADIGGTNARFALVGEHGAPACIRVLASRDYAHIADAIEAYLAGTGMERPDEAAIAIATPVTGDNVRMTNLPWAFSARALKSR